MKTVYKKTLMWKYLKLPALIFFLLALSYNVKAQVATPRYVCYGSPINLFCATLYGCGLSGSTYTWTDAVGNVVGTTQDVVIPFGSPAYHNGPFYLAVQYLPSGLSSGTANVTLLSQIVITGTTTMPTCNNGSNGQLTVTVSGGRPAYSSYVWSNGATTKNISGLSANTYTITVTDANSCTGTQTFTLTNPDPIVIAQVGTSGSNLTCNGDNNGYVNTSVSGGTSPYNYTWSNGSTTSNISSLTAGTYYVTVSDANACTKTNSFVINEPTAIVINKSGTDLSCNGDNNGIISITASGGTPGYSYAWSNGGGNVAIISGLVAGVYSVTVTDASSCTKTGSWSVTAPSALTLTKTVHNVSCGGLNDGSATATVSGGTSPYNYNWSNGHTATGVSDGIASLAAGSYTVTVTDGNLCTKTDTFVITANPALSLSLVAANNPLCNSSSDGSITVSVSGGAPAYSYSWNNGQTVANATGLATGTYSVTVTDAGSCTITGSYSITAPTALSLSGLPTAVKCKDGEDGMIDVTVGGGIFPYSYVWEVLPLGAGQGDGTPNVYGLVAGTYSVTVTDNNSCEITGSWVVTEPTALSGNGVVNDVTCNGGSNGTATISGFGGTPGYNYIWSTGSTSQLITGLSVGRYYVTITDANSCPNNTWQDI
ncbi:MAG: SprB repeat-containing protein, partial [Bacteroidales bacterium]